jgi:hypothetical protein
MSNDLPYRVSRGTLGELLAQAYLLAHGVQAAPPIRDSGNDLIACRGRELRTLQVKTRKGYNFSKNGLPRIYDGLIFVVLKEDDSRFGETKPDLFLLSRTELENAASLGKAVLADFRLSTERVADFFASA